MTIYIYIFIDRAYVRTLHIHIYASMIICKLNMTGDYLLRQDSLLILYVPHAASSKRQAGVPAEVVHFQYPIDSLSSSIRVVNAP